MEWIRRVLNRGLLLLVTAHLACAPEPDAPPDRYLFPTGVYSLAVSEATEGCANQVERSSAVAVPINNKRDGQLAIVTFVFYRFDPDLDRMVTEIGYQDFSFVDPNLPAKAWSVDRPACGAISVTEHHALVANTPDGFTWRERRDVTTETPCDLEAEASLCAGETTYVYSLQERCGDGCEAQLLQTSSDPAVRGRCDC